jgi:hypothetical protein
MTLAVQTNVVSFSIFAMRLCNSHEVNYTLGMQESQAIFDFFAPVTISSPSYAILL